MKNLVKFTTDFLPVILFFVTFKIYGLLTATLALLIASIIGLALHYWYHRTIPTMLLVTTAIVVFMGSLTILSGNTMFVKMKPTIVSLIFAIVLFVGIIRKQAYIRKLFNNNLDLSDENWLILSKRFAGLFISIAVLNEIIWRNMSEEIWVNFKVFGIMGMFILFIISQIKFLYKNQISK